MPVGPIDTSRGRLDQQTLRRAVVAAGVAGLLAAGAYGTTTLLGAGSEPPPPAAPHAATGRTSDDVLLDAIESRPRARLARTPAAVARREYRDWIAERFGPTRGAAPQR